MEALRQNITVSGYLDAAQWEKTYGEAYEKWRKERWVASSDITRKFLEHLLPLGVAEGEKRLLPHQAEALQRVIFSFEQTSISPLLVTLATGTGKTVVIASVMAWLACREEIAKTFLLLCPNTIVRDRLKRDFADLEVFREFKLFPPEHEDKLHYISCTIVEDFQNCTNLLGKKIIVANRHQFQRGYSGGNDHLMFLQNEGGDLAVFNDEAHNTRGTEYARSLSILKQQTQFRLDVTATPDRADNLRPQSHEIYSLSVAQAITGRYKTSSVTSMTTQPRLVKDVVVQRPATKTLELVQFQELKFYDDKTKNEFTVREIDWDDWPKQKSLQLVMDPGGMKLQLTLAHEALEKKKKIAGDRYKPLLFVIAPSIAGAHKAVEMMKADFNLEPLLVVGEIEDKELSATEKKKLREEAANIGSSDSPYDSVVSVYMLREGWDVQQVSVMCLLRGFGSPLFAHQVLGRGLRLIRDSSGKPLDNNLQELTVIDHPCLQLDDLWANIDALILEGDEIAREREINRDGSTDIDIDEQERKEEQVVVREDLLQLLQEPSPKNTEDITTERMLEMLEASLEILQEQRLEDVVIVGAAGDNIERLRPQRTKEIVAKPFNVSALPKTASDRDREYTQGMFKKSLMQWAEDYCEQYPSFVTCDGVVYDTLLKGFEKYVFKDQQITEVNAHALFGANNAVPQLQEAVTYDLNHRVYAEEVLLSE